jgi:glycosyltransferase involved in cell wall biosynthesis
MAISWRKFDTLVILGTPGCIALPFFRIFGNTKTIVNFGGLEWARDKWNSLGKKYLKLTERVAVKNATVMVADNQFFCNYIKETYNIESVLIEYGGNHTRPLQLNEKLKMKYPFLNTKYDVSVSRAQVDNNLHLLLEAYSKNSDRNLVLISNYDSFEFGRELKDKYKGFPNLYLQDAVYDINELDVIRSNAQLYVHSHSFCGTAPSLVEAMNLNLPVIAFDVPTNHFTTEDKALYFKNGYELNACLKTITIEKRDALAKSMGEIAGRRYTWEIIAEKYAKLF